MGKVERAIVAVCFGLGMCEDRAYRGISFIRNTPLLGPYSRTIPRVLWWS